MKAENRTEMSPFDTLRWENDDGTSCDATYEKYLIYIVCCDKYEGDYWRIVDTDNSETLIAEGYGESNLKERFNQLATDSGMLPNGKAQLLL